TNVDSDAAYLGLLMAAAWMGVRWVAGGERVAICVALCVLATLQRQHGALLAPALTLALARYRRPFNRRDGVALVALWVGLLAAVWFPLATGANQAVGASVVGRLAAPRIGFVVGSLLEF